jgi:chloramphenicol 3-O phosphotransferase
VVCPLAVVQERERSRGDRTLGWAGAHYDVIHRYLPYDLTVDTSRADPSGCAEAVAAELARRFRRPCNVVRQETDAGVAVYTEF